MTPIEANELRFWIPGPAVPKARARTYQAREAGVTVTRTVTPTRTREYAAWVKLTAQRAIYGWKRKLGAAWDAESMHFRVSIDLHDGGTWVTVSWWKAERANRTSDLDNIAKAILDGCNGAVWKDDRQVMDLRVCDMLSPKPIPKKRQKGHLPPKVQRTIPQPWPSQVTTGIVTLGQAKPKPGG